LRSDLDKTNKSFDHPRTTNKKKRRSNAIEETLKIANDYSESINNQQNTKEQKSIRLSLINMSS
jgi:hypothetical protein